jgi:hypothetical protein
VRSHVQSPRTKPATRPTHVTSAQTRPRPTPPPTERAGPAAAALLPVGGADESTRAIVLAALALLALAIATGNLLHLLTRFDAKRRRA